MIHLLSRWMIHLLSRFTGAQTTVEKCRHHLPCGRHTHGSIAAFAQGEGSGCGGRVRLVVAVGHRTEVASVVELRRYSGGSLTRMFYGV